MTERVIDFAADFSKEILLLSPISYYTRLDSRHSFMKHLRNSLSVQRLLRAFASLALVGLFFAVPVFAQQTDSSQSPDLHAGSTTESTAAVTAPKVPAAVVADDLRYRIGPGDILDIKVFNKPQFNREGVRVDPRGMIRMPLIKEEIQAACQTEEALESKITELLKEYIREPQVTVQIKEYQSEPVAVLGAVRAPSRFQLQRRVRLLELITFVNGPADNAGRTVQVVHMGSRSLVQWLACCRRQHPVRSILTSWWTHCAETKTPTPMCRRAMLSQSRWPIRFMSLAMSSIQPLSPLTEPMTVSRGNRDGRGNGDGYAEEWHQNSPPNSRYN